MRTGGQRLLELLGLLLVGNDQGVEVARAAHLELGVLGVLLDLDRLGVLPARLQQEVLDLHDLLRLHEFNSTSDATSLSFQH